MSELVAKAFEIRDKGTFIPVIATRLESEHPAESYLLGRAGYRSSEAYPFVVLYRLHDGVSCTAPYDWGFGARTMTVAHAHIEKHWDLLETGSVVDVEYILGETKAPKFSERLEAVL